MSDLDNLREELLKTDQDFRQLYEQHQECERQLTELQAKSLPSQQDEIEEKRIKRQKLIFKDRMALILADRAEAPVTA